jgi:transcriptional regulator with XRE-family HTH domain
MANGIHALKVRLGRNVRRARRQRGLSQIGLWEKSTVDFTMISKIERGLANPTLQTIYRLAKALGVDAQDLLAKEPLVLPDE